MLKQKLLLMTEIQVKSSTIVFIFLTYSYSRQSNLSEHGHDNKHTLVYNIHSIYIKLPVRNVYEKCPTPLLFAIQFSVSLNSTSASTLF